MKPRLLDLFCCAGGAAKGYQRAGFYVVGVDIKPQPRYAGDEFHQDDALHVLRELAESGEWIAPDGTPYELADLAGIHASPPCQHYSDLAKRNGNADQHPDLIGTVRDLLVFTGLPYVIENVESAPLLDPQLACGTAFGLRTRDNRGAVFTLRRHRLFETNFPLWLPKCLCSINIFPIMDVTGGGPTRAPRRDGGGGRPYKGTADEARAIMGMPWATKAELNEAIPPAYTWVIGHQLMAHVAAKAAA